MANRVCKQCGTPLASNETFCGNCGSRYIESSSEGLTQLSQPYSGEAQPGQRVIEPTQPALPPSSSHSSSPYDNTLYGPPPPGYNMPPTQQERYTPPPQSYNTPPTQQQKRFSVRTILLGVIALVIIVAAAGGFFFVHTNQVAQQNANPGQ